jgi:hypothetical protein
MKQTDSNSNSDQCFIAIQEARSRDMFSEIGRFKFRCFLRELIINVGLTLTDFDSTEEVCPDHIFNIAFLILTELEVIILWDQT